MKSSPTSATGLWPLLERSSSVRMLVVLEPFLADFARSPDDFRTCLPLSSLMELRVLVYGFADAPRRRSSSAYAYLRAHSVCPVPRVSRGAGTATTTWA